MPEEINRYIKEAEWASRGGDWMKAIINYEKASEVEPAHVKIYWIIADCYWHLHLWAETKKAMEKAIQMDPELKFSRWGPSDGKITIADLEKMINRPPLTKKEAERIQKESYERVMKEIRSRHE